MKKIAFTLVLVAVLSFTNFADDGDIHTGGKTCPQGQTCLAAPTNPGNTDNSTFTDIFEFFTSIIG